MEGELAKLNEALSSMDRYGAEHVGGMVLGKTGTLATFGEVDHVFALASVSKLASALAVLVAIEERTISLDDEAGPPGSSVAHLLAHASGLSPDDAGVMLASPGTARIYSNAGFDVLAEHLERASGMAIAQYLHEAVLAPLAMDASELIGSAARGLRASAQDLAKFAAELLSPTLVSPETLSLATSVRFPGLVGIVPGFGRYVPCDWGLGFEIKDAKDPHWTSSANSPATFGHFGQAGSFLWVDPVLEIALIALSDRAFGPWAKSAWPATALAVCEAIAPR